MSPFDFLPDYPDTTRAPCDVQLEKGWPKDPKESAALHSLIESGDVVVKKWPLGQVSVWIVRTKTRYRAR